MLKAAVAAVVLSISSFASAGVIISDATDITTTAQEYNTAFNLTDTAYSNILLELTAKGDYGKNSSEYIQFFIDGNLLAQWTYDTADISVTENYSEYDYTLTGVVSISDALWDTISSDNTLDVMWKNASQVNAYRSQGGADYVSFSLVGVEVPEPTTLALFALGLMGLASRRFKKQ